MEKVFWKDPYLCTLQTRVASVHGPEILFEKTIAYSFSGGQESDVAFVNGIEVISSRMEGPLIFYTLPEGHGLAAGDEALMTIEWMRRHHLMRLHFAAELILELVTKKHPLEKVGAHIAASKARIDFKSETNISAIFDDILKEYTAIIHANYPIETGFSDVQTQRRFWKIEGLAEVPCGGTHVRSTAG